jgi:hypothetical protein
VCAGTARENKNIIISKADKGNIVVVQDKVSCEEKMQPLLEIADYKLLPKDPTKSVEKIIEKAIKLSKEFDAKTRLSLTHQFSKAPHIYSLVKVHKPGFPIRPIVSARTIFFYKKVVDFNTARRIPLPQLLEVY